MLALLRPTSRQAARCAAERVHIAWPCSHALKSFSIKPSNFFDHQTFDGQSFSSNFSMFQKFDGQSLTTLFFDHTIAQTFENACKAQRGTLLPARHRRNVQRTKSGTDSPRADLVILPEEAVLLPLAARVEVTKDGVEHSPALEGHKTRRLPFGQASGGPEAAPHLALQALLLPRAWRSPEPQGC